VRVHVREQADDFKRLGEVHHALWTPTIIELDPDGTEQHRVEGFLPADELLAQLTMGLGHGAFRRRDWQGALQRFTEVLKMQPDSEMGAEAAYWSGVARYKSGDTGALSDTARLFSERFQDTAWAKRASVWTKRAA
jgi:hypothetical protein